MELIYVRYTGRGTSGGKAAGRVYRAAHGLDNITYLIGSMEEFNGRTASNTIRRATTDMGFSPDVVTRSIYTRYTETVTVHDYLNQQHITLADLELHPESAGPRGLIA